MNDGKEKAAPAATGTALDTALKSEHSNAADPLVGWFALAKPARDQQEKKAWLRRKGGGNDR